jgi:PTH1 family peptidyl-tRNA hydrolase
MKLIVGLGNPGRLYTVSRHNIGFSVVRSLARHYKVVLKKDGTVFSLSNQVKAEGLILALPMTFMNLSGSAVKGLLKKYKVSREDLLIVCDDLDLELGRIKIRPRGSSGGHRGLRSIIGVLESEDFCRLRLGIGRPQENVDTADYVLAPFAAREKEKIAWMVREARDCCLCWVSEGIGQAMNIFNKISYRGSR